MKKFSIRRVPFSIARDYIRENHYSHGCHNGASPCYGLYDGENLIGCLMFATPCSENVRASVFGAEYKNCVIELHRLHILDVTPKNTESWFISRCLKQLKKDKPHIKAVISFSDMTEGHCGTIYKATNFYYVGTTGKRRFFRDANGVLRHPRQCGVNISIKKAKELGWTYEMREAKKRYLFILAKSKAEKRHLIKMCKLDLQQTREGCVFRENWFD